MNNVFKITHATGIYVLDRDGYALLSGIRPRDILDVENSIADFEWDEIARHSKHVKKRSIAMEGFTASIVDLDENQAKLF